MSGITDNAATQAHDIVEQAEVEEQKVQGDKAITGDQTAGVGVEGSSTAATGDQHAEGQNKSKLDKVKEALHLKK
ncbi:hypothetical protein N8I77_007544 [Diaporthe amygdali]|uniref:Uncharacterized protein n=1 Tax=Phomopsis amygdali TaxID=1214568 RepID=A0AAD9SEL4_PHOAM|nr:uncharacterized protein J7T55_014173 [Diaporthe amygdali]KAJ0109611.1 hypothetical protein J7T55_014173 [Diaporthe amygdali]KAK2604631.1 hypothetical protein N8I77_007544 [Diaporthe amygdali]